MLLLGSPARAQDAAPGEEPPPQEPDPVPTSQPVAEAEVTPEDDGLAYWTITFLGTFLTPTGSLADTHDPGLGTALSIGWVGHGGFGAQIELRYAPIPHDPVAVTQIDAHMFYGTLAIQYAFFWRSVRLWTAAGAGAVAERVRTEFRETDISIDWLHASTLYGAAGLELHLFSNGGPGVAASYSQSVQGDDYSFYALSAGLTFVF